MGTEKVNELAYRLGGRRPFNENWKFHPGDAAGAELMSFDDNAWRTLTLPHDWGVEGSFSEAHAGSTGYLPAGTGWYRRKFALPPEAPRGKVLIQFDGVYKRGEIWINGHYLGCRPYGYSTFFHDLTPYLREGGEANVLAVKVNHEDVSDSRWYTGSGIYRPVFLHLLADVHIAPWGVYVTTPRIAADSAEADVEVRLSNSGDLDQRVTAVVEVRTMGGTVEASRQLEVGLPAGGEEACRLALPIANPALWSPDCPNLYQAEVRILRDGQVVDAETVTFGVRHYRFDPDEGFFLNGVNLKMKGVCNHHDAGVLGAAVPKAVWRKRLEDLKAAGCNAIRMSHNPPDPALLDLCDEMGFLVMDEAFDEWAHPKKKWPLGRNVGDPVFEGYAEDFAEWAERDLRDMVLRDRNHPSIIFWSIGNEIDYPNDPYSSPLFGQRYQPENPDPAEMGAIAGRLAEVVRAADRTRPVTAALACVPMSNRTDFPDALDVVGYNYQENDYEPDHRKYPNRVIYGSENGKHLAAWLAVEQNRYICGQFLWTGYDFLGEADGWPNRNSRAGLLDLAGNRKPSFYYRQSLWSDRPMVGIGLWNGNLAKDGGIEWQRDVDLHWPGNRDAPMKIVCCTNCESVELFLNGASLGVRHLKDFPDRTLRWETPYRTGVLKAVGIRQGEVCCNAELRSHGAPARLEADVERGAGGADWERGDIVFLRIRAVDEQGVRVPEARHPVNVRIEGAGELLGLENGDSYDHDDYRSDTRRLQQGRLLAYVRVKDGAGRIAVRIGSPELGQAVVEI